MASKTIKSQRKPRRARSWRRLLWGAVFATPVAVVGLWIAVNKFEWLGPLVADSLRAVIGKEAVTELENIAYGVQDRLYRYTRGDEQPKAYWEVPETTPPPPEPAAEEPPPDAGIEPELPPFRPKDVGPVHASWSAPGDGQWVPIAVPDLPDLPPHMFKTLLHPDKNRSWAELFVVAMRIRDIDLHLVAGSKEPVATEVEAEGIARPGKIPEAHHALVLAAFNGGFKTEHGKYGMRLGDTTFVAARTGVCVVAAFDDDSVQVGSWDVLQAREQEMRFWRQTPNCMYEGGKLHPKLQTGQSKKWGATLDGETVIRRSAIGVDATASTLYVGISNHTTAHAIALGMNHAGAANVAQLDVNFSFPKFVLFESQGANQPRQAVALADGFEFSVDEFIRKAARRDFFYVTPRSMKATALAN